MKYTVLVIAVFSIYIMASALAEDVINVEPLEGGLSGDDGHTTTYWDCCKPACANPAHAQTDLPVEACEADGLTRAATDAVSGCVDGGTAFACTDQHSWMVNSTFALGYAGGTFKSDGGLDYSLCCACFLLTYPEEDKKLVVQVVNAGSDYTQNQFDIAMPGGGVGLFTEGCAKQWGAPVGGWGEQYGGVTSEEECYDLPEELQEYCLFRWRFYEEVPHANVTFAQVKCPTQLTEHTKCVRDE